MKLLSCHVGHGLPNGHELKTGVPWGWKDHCPQAALAFSFSTGSFCASIKTPSSFPIKFIGKADYVQI